jgi:spermidine synthase
MPHRRLPCLLTTLPIVLLLAAGQILAAPPDAGPPTSNRKVVFDARSKWNRVIVIDEGDLRSLVFREAAGDAQSTISLRDPRAVPMEYIRHAAGAAAFPAQLQRALVIGLGGGTFPMLFRRSFPDLKIDVVELDPLVRKVARRHFGFVEDERLRVRIADGAAYLRRTRRRWDLILLDAYGAAGIPGPLATNAFFADVARSLTPGGIAVANIASTDPEIEHATVARFARAFPACVLQRTPDSDNVIAVAGAALPESTAAALRALDRQGRLPFPVVPMASLYQPCRDK